MNTEKRVGLKIFWQYSILIVVLGGYNFYRYFSAGGRWSLIVGIVCTIVFIVWIVFYFVYVKGKEGK